MGVMREIGRLGSERGRKNEERMYDSIVRVRGSVPLKWITSIRRATRTEDREGVDLIVESDVGPLYLQVKSSAAGQARFERRRRKKLIACIVVPACDEELDRRVRASLTYMRATIKKKRAMLDQKDTEHDREIEHDSDF